MEYVLLGISICLSAMVLSMIGMGGNVLFIPILLLFGFDLKTMVMPTGYILMLINTFSASVTYIRLKRVNFNYALPLIGGTVLGALSGSWLSLVASPAVIKLAFSLIVIFLAIDLMRKEIRAGSNEEDPEKIERSFRQRIVLGGLIGFVAGNITGFIGVGGGFIMVPVLIYLGLKAKNAAATSTFIIIFPALTSLSSRLLSGKAQFDIPVLIICIIAVIIGSQVGAHFMHYKLKNKTITRILAIALVLVAIKLIVDVILAGGWK